MLKLLFEEETPLREEGAAKLILPRTARDLLRSRVGAEVIDDFKITKPIYQAIRKVPQWDRESAPFYTITHSSHGEMTIGDLRVRGHAGPYEDEPVEAAVEHYWERLATGNADFWYGAGVAGSVFQDRSLVFNVDNIPSLLDQFVEGEGITSETSFIGVWGSSFPWHSEDMRLWSANVLLYGAPKYWYVLPASQSQKLEELADAYAYESANCTHYMMHKRSQICPSFLSRRGFTPRTTVHTHGEIMVVAPNAYHMGFEYMRLWSANVLLYGAPKYWYVLPASQSQKLEELADAYAYESANCTHYMMHKRSQICPSFLSRRGFTPRTTVHTHGEIMVVAPNAYHMGFEDMRLWSANVLLDGAPKYWYVLPASQSQKLEELADAYAYESANCTHYMMHKRSQICPSFLSRRGFTPRTTVHTHGEIMVVAPNAYHMGFEDMRLWSANVLLYGAPKYWYVLPASQSQKLEELADAYAYESANCTHYMMHKRSQICPSFLSRRGFTPRTTVHTHGEIMVVAPNAYHMGFEDMRLWSANVLLYGAPKYWYVLPASQSQKLEELADAYAYESANCTHYMMHKRSQICPSFLSRRGFTPRTTVHTHGEIMVVAPNAYHMGFEDMRLWSANVLLYGAPKYWYVLPASQSQKLEELADAYAYESANCTHYMMHKRSQICPSFLSRRGFTPRTTVHTHGEIMVVAPNAYHMGFEDMRLWSANVLLYGAPKYWYVLPASQSQKLEELADAYAYESANCTHYMMHKRSQICPSFLSRRGFTPRTTVHTHGEIMVVAPNAYHMGFEDMRLWSANVLLDGAPKYWYVLPASQSQKLEELADAYAYESANCTHYMMHKRSQICPSFLSRRGFTPRTTVHTHGEIMVVAPNAYHMGFEDMRLWSANVLLYGAPKYWYVLPASQSQKLEELADAYAYESANCTHYMMHKRSQICPSFLSRRGFTPRTTVHTHGEIMVVAPNAYHMGFEDMRLWSANVLLYGAPKYWYVLPASQSQKLEELADAYAYESANCTHYMMHKRSQICPSFLSRRGFTPRTTVHTHGEIMVVAPNAYHMGFEDMRLWSANVLLYGAPKYWYVLPASQSQKLEELADAYAYESANCTHYMMHKRSQICPSFLSRRGFTPRTTVHTHGEIMVVAPNAYHMGFEDMRLWSANVLLYGAPKYWYVLPASQSQKLEELADAYAYESANCTHYMMHKRSQICPSFLSRRGFTPRTTVHTHGEIMVVAPNAYHMGFEDMRLWSANVLLDGAPKYWYVLPASQSQKLEELADAYAYESANCTHYMMHKRSQICPSFLSRRGFTPRTTVHTHGEIMVVAPNAYHMGFEDMRLWSANVLLDGAPKYWYVLPASQSQKLEELADAYAYESANCTHYMMHKRSQICPSFLSRRGFTPRTTVHTHGEIMVVAPNAYHMGFEDMRLWSANVLLDGAPKYWYVLPASQSQKLEELADAYAYESANCTHYMMHKRSQICPSFLSRRGFTPRTTVQTHGEIMVVAPNAYHMGFNLGLNIAESKNFATHSWIKDGKEAKACSCRGRARAGAKQESDEARARWEEEFPPIDEEVYEEVEYEEEDHEEEEEEEEVKEPLVLPYPDDDEDFDFFRIMIF
ncbi:unnamed protein product [Bemisia tabaci]|uniref:JmjC domain-containing protein n=1 Tax=Bemisia tabaci TaxID=7038 RepID=A0A9P0AAW4_BEMTA|nr:unnamed protein product [Bemisia tabaci]